MFVHAIISGSSTLPDDPTWISSDGEPIRLPYLATFDHEPSPVELDVYRPDTFAHDAN